MISESPWLIANQSAGNMTGRNLNGQLILQKKRAKGTFTPSVETLNAQAVAALIWQVFRPLAGAIRKGWTSKLQKQEAAAAWYKYAYHNMFTGLPSGSPVFVPGNIQVALGTITPTAFTASIDASASELTLNWPTTIADDTQLAEDLVGFGLYNVNTDYEYSQTLGVGVRGTGGTTIISFPAGTFTAGDIVRVIPFFYGDRLTANAGKSSNSENISVTVAA